MFATRRWLLAGLALIAVLCSLYTPPAPAAPNVIAVLPDTPPTAPVPPELAGKGIGQAGGRPDKVGTKQKAVSSGQPSVDKTANPQPATRNPQQNANPQSALGNSQSPDS